MVSFSNQIRIMMSTRAGYRDHLREEICKAKAADTIDARNFRVERAGEYADLLAGSEAPEGIEHWKSPEYLEQGLVDADCRSNGRSRSDDSCTPHRPLPGRVGECLNDLVWGDCFLTGS
jgi:hypothetical protein